MTGLRSLKTRDVGKDGPPLGSSLPRRGLYAGDEESPDYEGSQMRPNCRGKVGGGTSTPSSYK